VAILDISQYMVFNVVVNECIRNTTLSEHLQNTTLSEHLQNTTLSEHLQNPIEKGGPDGSMSWVVGSNNSYKPITNTAWVRAKLCKLQKNVHSNRSRK
jgi:hypothetical protein